MLAAVPGRVRLTKKPGDRLSDDSVTIRARMHIRRSAVIQLFRHSLSQCGQRGDMRNPVVVEESLEHRRGDSLIRDD